MHVTHLLDDISRGASCLGHLIGRLIHTARDGHPTANGMTELGQFRWLNE